MPSWKLILLLVSAPLHLSSCCCPSDHSFPGRCTVLFLLLDSRESYSLRACPQCSVSVICTEGLVSLSKFVHLEKVRATIGTQEFCLQSPCSSSHFIFGHVVQLAESSSQTRAQTQVPAVRATSPNNWADFPRVPALKLC